MKLIYRGTGTVLVEGVGEVSHGGSLEVPDELGRVLVQESPENWSVQTSAKVPARGTGGVAKG